MSTSGVGPTPSTWHYPPPSASRRSTSAAHGHDRKTSLISLFKNEKRESWIDQPNEDSVATASRSHRHFRSFSVGDLSFSDQEEREGEEMMPRRNQEENLRLQMKADELERIFAEHKRRFEGRAEREETKGAVNYTRGRMYDRYMEMRDAKRREEMGRSRDLKEAKMRKLRESVDKTQEILTAWYHRQEEEEEEELLYSDKNKVNC